MSTPSLRVTLFFMESRLSLTKYWLESIVIGLDLCPFAKIPFEAGLIRIAECEDQDEDAQMLFFLDELELLNQTPASDISTTIIAYPFASEDFSLFNDFVGELEFMLEEASLENVFQLVAFHPRFVFENLAASERGNLVNRSPLPILHILRSEEIARAMRNPKDGEVISFNNDKKLNELSQNAIEQLFYYLK